MDHQSLDLPVLANERFWFCGHAFETPSFDNAEQLVLQLASVGLILRDPASDAVLEGASRNYGRLEDQRPELLHVLAQGDQVAVIARERGRVKATGKEYEMAWMHLYTFRDGQVTRIYGFCDNHSMIEAAKAG